MIPNQLKSIGFRFIVVEKNGKKPIEKDWTNERNYEFNNGHLLKHINNGGNYGVLCGCRGLIVIDFDTHEAQNKYFMKLPKTFTVRTAGKRLFHCYFFIDGEPITRHLKNTHGLDIQGAGTMVLGAGSKINGKYYEVVYDFPIETIEEKQLGNIFDFKDIKQDLNYKEIFAGNIKEGNRNESLFKAACSLKTKGVDKKTCYALIITTNKNFQDPLPQDEIVTLVNSAYSYKDDQRGGKKEFAFLDNRISLAESLWEKYPFFYDKSEVFWFWDEKKQKYERKDDVDVLNMIYDSFSINTSNTKTKMECLTALKQVGRKHIPKTPPKTWIQVQEGVYDCEKDLMLSSTPDYFLTNPIALKIGEDENTPVLEKIFIEWVGEKWKDTLYEILAYCLLPDYPIHRIFCLVGSGMNGKSKFLELMRRFIGTENISATQLDLLTGTNKSRFETIKLYKKLVCEMGETNFNLLSQTNVLKQITGQDLISYEFKGKTPFSDYSYAKILIATNSLPPTTDKTIGFYRRWIIIDFPNTFTEKRDILKDIPPHEYNNLLRKSLKILNYLIKRGEFSNEGSIEDRRKRYEDKSDPLQKFLEDKCQSSFDGFIFKYDFRDYFQLWCKNNGFRQWSSKEIGSLMKQKGFEDAQRGDKSYRAWLGIEFKALMRDDSHDSHDSHIKSTYFPIYRSNMESYVNPVNPVNLEEKEYIKSILLDKNEQKAEIQDLVKKGINEEIIKKMIEEGELFCPSPETIKLI